jgi:sensor histidine kinase regulating citrate/malate metabolism
MIHSLKSITRELRTAVGRFDDETEKLYYEDFFRISLPVVRVALFLGVLLYSLFGILDIWIVPLNKGKIWIIRYAVVCPALITVFIISYFTLFKKIMQSSLSFVSFLSGLGIVFMIGIADVSELGYKYYYAGLMLVIMWIYALVRLRFIYATIISWLLTFTYEIVAIYLKEMLATPENITVFINNNFFFLSANIIGMLASFTIEYYLRKNFLLRNEVERAFTMNQKYLDNIKEGLILINREYTILDQYSGYMGDLFKTERISGVNFVDFIYPDILIHKEERAELEKFLNFLFHNRHADMEMIMEINPLREKKVTIFSNGKQVDEITVNAGFIRVMKDEDIEHIMIIFEDLTDIIKYQAELNEQRNRHQAELESLSAILKMGPDSFMDFFKESYDMLDDMVMSIHELHEPDINRKVFRKVHSLKGTAKYLELNHIVKTAHLIEDKLEKYKTNTDFSILNEETSAHIQHILDEFRFVEDLIVKIKNFSDITLREEHEPGADQLERFFNSLHEMVTSISTDLDKEIKLEINNSVRELPFFKEIRSPIIHLVRNSIDHGIEDKFERLGSGKPETGIIRIDISNEDGTYIVAIGDDGRGVDFKKVMKKALEKKLISQDDARLKKSKLLSLMFTPDFSTSEQISDLSGRGVGLDAVKDSVNALGGQIGIITKENQGTRFTIKIPGGNNSRH